MVYARELENHHLLNFYYLLLLKSYQEEKNTRETILPVEYLQKKVSKFYKDYLDKPTAMSPPIDITTQMAMTITRPVKSKQKYDQPTKVSIKVEKAEPPLNFRPAYPNLDFLPQTSALLIEIFVSSSSAIQLIFLYLLC